MAERYVWSQYEEAIGFDRYSILVQDAELAGDAPYQVTIPSRFRRSDQHECLSAGRKPAQLTKKMGFEASVEREDLGKKASHSELLCAELSDQLDDCQWVSLGLRNDSAYRSTIEWPGRTRSEQLTGRHMDQPDQMQFRESVEWKRMIYRIP
jgi:hypothetical protein